jgi:DNA-binding XRE family transcriptional regulator
MTDFEQDLAEQLKDPEFKKIYEEEGRVIDMCVEIVRAREREQLSQQELAKRSGVTRQQISKLENGANCNLRTLVRVSATLGFTVNLAANLQQKQRQRTARQV